jgi:Mor family transcriptional regulator
MVATVDQQDIIIDIMERVAQLLGAPLEAARHEQALLDLERGIREIWGGDRPYIARRRGEIAAHLHSERNSRIWRAHQQGMRIALLAKREQISERQVIRILNGMRPAIPPRAR